VLGSHSLRGNCAVLDDYYLVVPAVEREMPRSVGLERVRIGTAREPIRTMTVGRRPIVAVCSGAARRGAAGPKAPVVDEWLLCPRKPSPTQRLDVRLLRVDLLRSPSARDRRRRRMRTVGQHRPLAHAVTRTFERRLRPDNGPSCAGHACRLVGLY